MSFNESSISQKEEVRELIEKKIKQLEKRIGSSNQEPNSEYSFQIITLPIHKCCTECTSGCNTISFRQNRIISKAIRDHILQKYKLSKKQLERQSHHLIKDSKLPTVVDSQSTINQKQCADCRQNFLENFKQRTHRKNHTNQQMKYSPYAQNKYVDLAKQRYLDYYNTAKQLNTIKRESRNKNKRNIKSPERQLSIHSKRSKKQRSSQNLYQVKNSIITTNKSNIKNKKTDKPFYQSPNRNRLIDNEWIKLQKKNFQIQYLMKKKQNGKKQDLNHKRYRSVAVNINRSQVNLEKSYKKAKKYIFKDSKHRNEKHEKDHLYNTYDLENRLREQIIKQLQRVNYTIKHKL